MQHFVIKYLEEACENLKFVLKRLLKNYRNLKRHFLSFSELQTGKFINYINMNAKIKKNTGYLLNVWLILNIKNGKNNFRQKRAFAAMSLEKRY